MLKLLMSKAAIAMLVIVMARVAALYFLCQASRPRPYTPR